MQAAATLNAALAQPTLVIALTTNDIAQGGQQEEAQVVPTVKGRKNSKFPSASAATEPATSAGYETEHQRCRSWCKSQYFPPKCRRPSCKT